MKYIKRLRSTCCQIPFKQYKKISEAKVGDIVVEGKNIVSIEDYNKQSKSAIGIVALEAKNTPDGKIRVLSLNFMSENNISEGSINPSYIYYGGYDNNNYTNFGLPYYNQFPCVSDPNTNEPQDLVQKIDSYGFIPTDYFTKQKSLNKDLYYNDNINNQNKIANMFLEDGTLNPLTQVTKVTLPGTTTTTKLNNPLTDFNGKENTDQILKICNEIPDQYKSSNGTQYKAPAAYLCKHYSAGKLDWYLPSAGELACIVTRLGVINGTRQSLGLQPFYYSYYFWSSTQFNLQIAVTVDGYSGNVNGSYRDYDYYVLACSAI